MKVPIAYGLSWPERIESGAPRLDFRAMADLSFESFENPEHQRRYPGLRLAHLALQGPPGSTAVLNAANEVAVEAFLQRRIRFDQIHQLNEQLLSQTRLTAPAGLDELLDLDAKVRSMAQDWVKNVGLKT